MNRWHWGAALIVLVAAGFVSSWVTSKDIGGRSYSGVVVIHASVAAIWSALVDPAKLATVSGDALLTGVPRYSKIGDASTVQSGSDTGELVVTTVRPQHEIRFTFEPRNGSYACQQQWIIDAFGDSTRVVFLERYTESGPETPAQVSAVAKGYDTMLGRLAHLAGGK